MTPADLIAEHNKIEDFLKAESKRFVEFCKPHQVRLQEIESELHQTLLTLAGGDTKRASIATDPGTAYLSTITSYKASDKEKYLDWCLENWNKYGAMLQIAAPQKDAVREYQDENDGRLPPFVESSSIVKVNIRRS